MKRLAPILFLLCCINTVDAQSFREQFTEANLLTEDGYYGLAIPIWRDLLREKQNANLNYKLGSCYLSLGIDRDRALPFLLKASKDIKKIYDPFSSDFKSAPVETYYYLAKAYLIHEDLDSAEFYYNKFLSDASKKQYLRPSAEKGLDMCEVARELMKNPVDAKIVNVGAPINSPYAEYSPIVAYDENTLYFTSRKMRGDGSNEGKIDARTGMFYEDMYVSFRSISGRWMEPELLNINVADAHSSVVSMSTDGRRIYIYKVFAGVGNIYESEFILGTGWTEPALVGSNVNSDANEFFATITADEQRLYFVSDRKGGLGGKDIWYSQKLPNGEWGKAINAGEPINTELDEDAPYLHPDGKTMYFSSNGHRTMGGYDIFYTQLGDDGTWGNPVNVGYPINTTDDDHSYIGTPDGNRAYYSSKGANTIGSTDIYVVEYGKEEDDQKPSIDMSVFALLKGWVFPAPGEAMPADLDIKITNIKTGEIKGQAKPVERNGSFVFIIPSGETYDVEFTLGDKSIYKERVGIPDGEAYQELSREVFLAPKGSNKEAIALKDEVLGDVLKWRLAFANPEKLIPIGSKVYYMDEQNNILDSAYVSKDGFFEFKKLGADANYVLRPVLADDIDGDLTIDAIGTPEKPIEMVQVEDTFYESGKVPDAQDIASNDPIESKPETPTEPVESKPQPPKPKQSTGEATKAKPTTPSKTREGATPKGGPISSQKEFTINYGFNVASDVPERELQRMASAIKSAYEQNGKVQLSLIGSASHLKTNRKGGNEELAQLRLKYGKSALSKELSKLGLDINKISTIDEEWIISGPKPEEVMEYTDGLFTDYQYFKVKLN